MKKPALFFAALLFAFSAHASDLRYYLSDIIGDGSEGNTFRPAVADYGVSWAADIATGDDGKPLYHDCLVVVNTQNHAKLRSDPRIDPMPDYPLDGQVLSISSVARTAMTAALQRRGFNTGALQSKDGFRDYLQAVGKQRSPTFDIDAVSVSQ